MTPTSKPKKGVRYRYYMSTAFLQGTPDKAGTISRAPAELIEQLVIDAVRKHVRSKDKGPDAATLDRDSAPDDNSRTVINQYVEKSKSASGKKSRSYSPVSKFKIILRVPFAL